MQFMLPKIIGITILAGILTIVAATIFKLLLAGTLLFGAVLLLKKFAGKRRDQLSYNEGNQNSFEGNKSSFNNFKPNFQVAKNEAAIYPVY